MADHVLITGGSRGLGAALADHYRAAGAEVLATARRAAPGQIALDVRDGGAWRFLARDLGEQPLDLMIANAGVYSDKGQTLDEGYSPWLWNESFATNVTGVFLGIQALLPALRRAAAARGVARVAILGSAMGSDARAPGGSYIYRASKAAVLNLGRNLATDLRAEGIAVGIYHPGWVRTDMGGDAAEVSVADSVAGLAGQIAALDLKTSGSFTSYDGTPVPF